MSSVIVVLYIRCSQIAVVRAFVSRIPLASLLPQLTRLEALVKEHKSLTCGGRFTWVDSPFVRALQNGDWLLLENVNFCAASVLDRLNCLLEKDGVLTISEAGQLFIHFVSTFLCAWLNRVKFCSV